MKRWIIAIALFVCWSDAAAATVACRSSPGADGYHQYRLIDNRKCWFRGHTKLEKSALAWKSENRRAAPANPAATAAGEAPGPSTLAADHVASASASRRGEPAPDFDAEFGHFRAYEVPRPVVHLLYPARVAQAYGARPVALVLYRKPE